MNAKKMILYAAFIVFCLSTAAFARAVWVEGTVTKAPHKIYGHYYIHMNGNLYKILPNVRITRRYERSRGAFDEEKASLDSISRHQRILMNADHNNVNRIILY